MWCYRHRQGRKISGLNGYTYSMAHLCHAGGGRTLETYTAESIIGQGITCKYSPIRQVKYSIFLKPLPGSTHDITAIRNTGLFGYMQPWHITADKGYVGLGCDTPFKRKPGRPLLEWQKRFNKGINQIRYVVERSIAHLKTWRILSTPCRLPQPTTIWAINVIWKIMFYQPPTEPHSPSS